MKTTSMIAAAAVAVTSLIASAETAAADFTLVRDEDTFRALVDGRELRRFGVRLEVHPDGRISGRGFGQTVTGTWGWSGNFFCRTLEWNTGSDPDNCQAVLRQDDTLRFVSDQGQGDHADFRLR